mmetsp:Transcript_20902/g.63935  ORF Transcript_20902/g.63935 Transcript_20902/m.63935 type:complete len:204 (+) Transcript_20902:651-1262(+)
MLVNPRPCHPAQGILRLRSGGELDKAVAHREHFARLLGVALLHDCCRAHTPAVGREELAQGLRRSLEVEVLDEERAPFALLLLLLLLADHCSRHSLWWIRCSSWSLAPLWCPVEEPNGRPFKEERHAMQFRIRDGTEGAFRLANLNKLDQRYCVTRREQHVCELAMLAKERAELSLRHFGIDVLDEDEGGRAFHACVAACHLR